MAGVGSAHDGVVPRLGDVSAALLAVALLAFGLVADRGLVAQVAALHEKSIAAAEVATRFTMASVRAALGTLEEQVLGGRPVAGSGGRAVWRYLPNRRSRPLRGFPTVGGRGAS